MNARQLVLPALLGASLGLYAAGCGPQCGTGTLLSDGTCLPDRRPTGEPIDVKVTSLHLDHGAADALYVDHPVRVTIGLTSKGPKSLVALSVGLTPRPGAPAESHLCYLGGRDAILAGTGDEEVFTYEFLVPYICTQGDYNLLLNLESTGGAPAIQYRQRTFSAETMGKPETEGCKGQTPEGDAAACSYVLQVKKSPGVDYSLAFVRPQSSIGVLYVSPPAGIDGVPGAPETPEPFSRVNWAVTSLGKDIDDPTGMARPTPLNIRYYIRAVKDAKNRGWRNLNFGPEPDPNDPSKLINPSVRQVNNFRPGLEYTVSNNLYLVDEFNTVIKGDWATEEEYYIKACLETDTTEVGDPIYSGVDGKANNCQTFPLRIVRALPPTQAASSQSFNPDPWKKDFGNPEKLQLSASYVTTNVLDLSGAHHTQEAKADLISKFLGKFSPFSLFKATVNAEALVSIVDSHIDANAQVFGFNIYTYSKKIDAVMWSQKYSLMKEFTIPFTYYIIPAVSVEVAVGGSGEVGVEANLSIKGTMTGMKPFDKAQKVGQIQGTVTPYGKLAGIVAASVNVVGFKATVKGTLTLVETRVPLVTTLIWGLTNLKPLTLSATGTATWDLEITSLGGSVDFILSVPFNLVKPGTYNFVTVEGKKNTYNLMNRATAMPITLGG